MFDIDAIKSQITESINNELDDMVRNIRASLSNPIYEKILKTYSIDIKEGELNFSLEVLDDFMAENQNIFRVITYGGILEKKDKEFVQVPPNMTLIKYFS